MASLSDPKKILLTGATGYIGGSILTALLNSSNPALQSAGPITCLLRGADRAAVLSSTYGDRVKPVLYRDLDDVETATAVAAEHDIVIHTTVGSHPASAQALVRGLAQRKASTGREVWMIHTSGTSNVGDMPITKPEVPMRKWDDAVDDVYGFEKELEALEPYPQRTAELGVIDAGLELGVRTVVIMSPIIYGPGTGLFNKVSMWTVLVHAMLQAGQAAVVGDGVGIWNHVHVEDLADLHEIVLLEILSKGERSLPTGKKGIMFSANGQHSWQELGEDVANACYELGISPDKTVARLSLEEAGRTLVPHVIGSGAFEFPAGEAARTAELLFSTNARTTANVARRLGWAPTRGDAVWKSTIRDEVKAFVASKNKE